MILGTLKFFKVGDVIVAKYGYYLLLRTFLDKKAPNTEFTYEITVVPCDVLVVKVLF